MDTVEIDAITKFLLRQIRNRIDDAANIAKAAEVCAESGNIVAAVRILMSAEDPVHLADRMLQATLIIRCEFSSDCSGSKHNVRKRTSETVEFGILIFKNLCRVRSLILKT